MEKIKLSRISGLMFVDIGLWSVKENKNENAAKHTKTRHLWE